MTKDEAKAERKNIKAVKDVTDRLIKIMDVIYRAQEELNKISEEAHELLRERLKRRGPDRR